MSKTSETAPPIEYPTGSARFILVATTIVCALLELIDTTVVNVALSEISGNIGASTTEIAWVVTSYGIANVLVIPLSAMLSALFGRKRYFTGSVLVFTFASLMCGLSDNLWMLVLWRFIQGLGGGGLLSTSQSIIYGAFPPEKASTATAIFGLGVILGPTFGPVMGGFITDNFSWHWIFFINVPIGVVAALLAWKYVPNLAGVKKPDKMDWWGIIFLIIGLGSLQYMLEEGGAKDWFESTEITIFALLAVLGLSSFIWRELKIDYPAVNLRLYKNFNLSMGNILNLVVGTAVTGSVFIFPLFAQTSLGWTATQTGAFMIPGAMSTAVAMIVVARLTKAGVNPKIIMIIGTVLMSTFLIWISNASPDAGSSFFFIPFLLRGVGAAFMMSPVIGLAVAGLTGRDLAQATGLSNMLRQMGGAMGIAFINIFLNTRTAQARSALSVNFTDFNQYASERLAGLSQRLIESGYAADEAASGAYRLLVNSFTRQQAVLAYCQGFFLMGLIILGCIPIILLLRYKKKKIEKPALTGH
ncbi:DHA2 family efflux MFS transporter permease subunit [Flavobacterium luteolum]|uniref:DHA2 family efflux MFS transporter permease subunit n=1 Tax=Flavobacterium luteolum TaxID=3003259 RepID=UPI00248E7ACE|nr:DHA2 family efflux MFS transporter permease subunit [Flavobacterium luteolum]